MKTLATAVSLALAAGSATAGVIFTENFDSGNLGQFTYYDCKTDAPSAFEWTNNEDEGFGNFTGGSGMAAMSNSDASPGAYDHAIVTPGIRLPDGEISMSFLSNYQNFANIDFADVDITADGGVHWNNILRYNEDHGAFYSTPGIAALIDLTSYAGQTVQVRFHHYNENEDAQDWYWQVDEFQVATTVPAPGAFSLLGAAGLLAARRRR